MLPHETFARLYSLAQQTPKVRRGYRGRYKFTGVDQEVLEVLVGERRRREVSEGARAKLDYLELVIGAETKGVVG